MIKLLKLAPPALACFCAATVIAQAVGLAVLWRLGSLNSEKLLKILAVIHDVDLQAARGELLDEQQAALKEQAALEDIIRARSLASLDMDLRENSMTKGLNDLRSLEKRLQTDQERYKQLKQSFDDLLAQLEGQKSDNAIQEVQRTLEVIQPKQAKEHILKMLEDDAMQHVVTIVKAMPLDKRKKIFGEFKEEEEAEKLRDILRQIRLGEPEATLIRDTRGQLQQF